MEAKKIDHYGEELHQALINSEPVEPLTEREPDLTLDEAYQIQLRMVQRQLDAGQRVVGKKIGVTSKAVQDMLNVHQPDFGHLLDGMVYGQSSAVPVSQMIRPKAEGEIAFLLGRDLQGPGVTNADVLRATELVMPCFEIVDSRVRDWRIRIQDTVADNASCGLLVLGDAGVSPRDLDLSLCGLVLERNGAVEQTGAGAAAMGSPVNCVTWLANTLGGLGIPLKAGEVILSGALTAMVDAHPGDNMRVAIGGLGSVSLRFV